MTAKQNEVLDTVRALMIEHFDAFAVVWNVADVDGTSDHETGALNHGGDAVAIGMLRCHVARLESRYRVRGEDSEV